MIKFILILLLLCTPAWATDYCDHANVVVCWDLEEGSGTTTDDQSSNNRDGTFLADGEPAWSTTSPPTNYTAYVDFDDANDYIYSADVEALDFVANAQDFTCYLKIDASTSSDYSRYLVKQDATSGDGWMIVDNTSNQISFVKEVSGTQTLATLFTVGAAGTWHDLFIQYDASENKAREYYDKSAGGWELITTGGSFGWPSDGKLYLGGRDNSSSSSTGSKIAAFACWNTILSAGEMDDISDNGLGVTSEPETTRRVVVFQ